jgi:hypothetical protein
VAVGLEVHADIETKSGVVKVLHTGVGADDGELQHLLDVVGTRAVGVGSLDDTNLELLGNASATSEVANERRSESGDAVTVKEAENIALVNKVVDQAIGVTV